MAEPRSLYSQGVDLVGNQKELEKVMATLLDPSHQQELIMGYLDGCVDMFLGELRRDIMAVRPEMRSDFMQAIEAIAKAFRH